MAEARGALYAKLAIPLVLLFFAAGVVVADRGLSTLRLDLTEERRFTLSPVTKEILAGLDEPVALRLYVSSRLTDVNPALAAHAARVKALLREIEDLAGANLGLEVIDPLPFSAAEDLALSEGLPSLRLGRGAAEQLYFGLTGRNAVDQLRRIDFFSPERAAFLEYDLAALLSALARPVRPRVGLLSSLPLDGNPILRQPPQTLLDLIHPHFDLTDLALAGGSVPDDISVIMLVQPKDLSLAEAYALDQFVLRGGRLLLFIDPYSEQEALMAAQMRLPPRPPNFDAFDPLLTAWGLRLPAGQVVADRLSAREVEVSSQGRRVPTDYVVWLAMRQSEMAEDEPVVARIAPLNLNTAGRLLHRDEAESSLVPLVWTSTEAEALPIERLAVNGDPTELLADYRPGGSALTLAARLGGRADSAFPDGPPPSLLESLGEWGDDLAARHLGQSRAGLDIIAVADSDLLYDASYITMRQGTPIPLAGNADFVINALESLSGVPLLGSLRGRGLKERPFTVIEDLRREAELTFRQRELALIRRIEETQQEIGDIEERRDGGLVLTQPQREAMAALRDQQRIARSELRDVQRGLRAELDRLVRQVQLINILAVPLLVAALGILVLLVRRRRALGGAARLRGRG